VNTTTLDVNYADPYTINDVIEIDNDGVSRTINNVDLITDQISFTPATSSAPTGFHLVLDYGIGGTAGWDFHLFSGSPCENTGDPDIKNADGSRSDMGAYGGPNGGVIGSRTF